MKFATNNSKIDDAEKVRISQWSCYFKLGLDVLGYLDPYGLPDFVAARAGAHAGA